MKHSLFLLFFSFVFNYLALSQSLKLFSGEFDCSREQGKAKYSYYEDVKTNERVKHGAFQYNFTQSGDFGNKFNRKIIGTYENGLKNGMWNYTLTYTDFPMSTNRNLIPYTTGIISLQINYKKGYPTGNCIYKCDLKYRNISQARGKINYGLFKDFKHASLNINYQDGLIVGPLNFSSYEMDLDFNIRVDEFYIKGQFDKKGNADGKWQYIFVDNDGGNGKIELNAEYKNGWRTKNLLRKFQTGKVIDDLELEAEDKQMVDEIISKNITLSDIPKKFKLKAVTGNIFDNFPIILNTIFNDDDFLFSCIDGDKELEVGKFDVKHVVKGGEFYVLKYLE